MALVQSLVFVQDPVLAQALEAQEDLEAQALMIVQRKDVTMD